MVVIVGLMLPELHEGTLTESDGLCLALISPGYESRLAAEVQRPVDVWCLPVDGLVATAPDHSLLRTQKTLRTVRSSAFDFGLALVTKLKNKYQRCSSS